MWSMGGVGDEPSDAERERIEQWIRRGARPDNEIPVSVPLDVVLARSGDLALTIGAANVYTNGVSFSLQALSRTSRHLDLFGPHRRGGSDAENLMLGVEFADGRRASTIRDRRLGPAAHPDDDIPTLTMGGGGGSDRRTDSEFFLTPVPPPGRLTFVVRWAAAGVAETSVHTTGDSLAAAVEGVVEVWPWQPPDRGEPPEPPDLPSTGWFGGP